jgi:hypothetical protein
MIQMQSRFLLRIELRRDDLCNLTKGPEGVKYLLIDSRLGVMKYKCDDSNDSFISVFCALMLN